MIHRLLTLDAEMRKR